MNLPRLSRRGPTRPPSLPISKLGKGAIGKYTHAHIHSTSCLPHVLTPVLFWGVGTICRRSLQNLMFFLWLPSSPMNSMRLCSSNRWAGAGHSWPVFIHFYPFKSVLQKGDSVVHFYLIGHIQRFPPFLNPKLQYMGIDPSPLSALSNRGPVVSNPLPPISQQPYLSHPFTPKSNGTLHKVFLYSLQKKVLSLPCVSPTTCSLLIPLTTFHLILDFPVSTVISLTAL